MLPLGQTVYLWRKERALTQGELANRVGMPRPNLSDIEQGKRDLTLSTLRAIAFALGIRPGILADGIVPPERGQLSSLSREALERIANAVAHQKHLHTAQEQELSRLLGQVVQHRHRASKGQKSGPRRGIRQSNAAWLQLKARLPEPVLTSLLQRIEEHAKKAD